MATCVRARDGLFVSGGREGRRAWSYGSMVCLFSWLVGWLVGWLGSEKIGHTGARTQDHSVISTALYRLSYTTSATIQHTQKQLHTPHTNQHTHTYHLHHTLPPHTPETTPETTTNTHTILDTRNNKASCFATAPSATSSRTTPVSSLDDTQVPATELFAP